MTDLGAALIASLDDDAVAALAERLRPYLPTAPADDVGYYPPAAAARYLGRSTRRVHDLKSSRAIEPDGYDGRTPLFTRQTLDAYARRPQ